MDSSYFFTGGGIQKPDPSCYIVDKKKSCDTLIDYMLIRLQEMFEYGGDLPDTIPPSMLEYFTMVNGSCYITEATDSKIYAFTGSFGGTPDGYYRPTEYIIANPGLKFNKTCNIETDGVLFRNDFMWKGLYPLISQYAYLMSENLITLRMSDIMLRILAMISAPNDATKAAGEEYLRKLEKGELSVIGERKFFEDGITLQSPPSNNGSYLTQFIELHQYLKGSFYNEVGLNANFNMKREALGDGETSLNDDILLPLCDQMLKCRKEDVAKINEKYGLHITVEYSSSWATNVKELELQLETMKKEASQLAESGDENGSGERDTKSGEESLSDSVGDADKGNSESGESDVDSGAESEHIDEHEHVDGEASTTADDTSSSGDGDSGSGKTSDDTSGQASGNDDKSKVDAGLEKEKKDE